MATIKEQFEANTELVREATELLDSLDDKTIEITNGVEVEYFAQSGEIEPNTFVEFTSLVDGYEIVSPTSFKSNVYSSAFWQGVRHNDNMIIAYRNTSNWLSIVVLSFDDETNTVSVLSDTTTSSPAGEATCIAHLKENDFIVISGDNVIVFTLENGEVTIQSTSAMGITTTSYGCTHLRRVSDNLIVAQIIALAASTVYRIVAISINDDYTITVGTALSSQAQEKLVTLSDGRIIKFWGGGNYYTSCAFLTVDDTLTITAGTTIQLLSSTLAPYYVQETQSNIIRCIFGSKVYDCQVSDNNVEIITTYDGTVSAGTSEIAHYNPVQCINDMFFSKRYSEIVLYRHGKYNNEYIANEAKYSIVKTATTPYSFAVFLYGKKLIMIGKYGGSMYYSIVYFDKFARCLIPSDTAISGLTETVATTETKAKTWVI